MITKKNNYLNKPIFWGLLFSSFNLFCAFYYLFISYYVSDGSGFGRFESLHRIIALLDIYLNRPVDALIQGIYMLTVVDKFSSSVFTHLYSFVRVIFLFFVGYISCCIIKTAKKRNWFDKPLFFGLLFSLLYMIYSFVFLSMGVFDSGWVDFYGGFFSSTWLYVNRPLFAIYRMFDISIDSNISDSLFILMVFLFATLLFIVGCIFGYLVKIIRKKFLLHG
jgi:hypothetical protein